MINDKTVSKSNLFWKSLLIGFSIFLVATCISIIIRDGTFSFGMLPLPFFMGGIIALIATIIFGVFYLFCYILNADLMTYYLSSIIYSICMLGIGLWSAPQAIF